MSVTEIGKIDGSRIPDDAWEFDSYSSDGLRANYLHWVDRERGIFIKKTVNLTEPTLLDLNRQEFEDSKTKRFGDGRVVARVPLNVFYRDFAKRLKEGDQDFTKWWLNNGDNRPYRNFRGKI